MFKEEKFTVIDSHMHIGACNVFDVSVSGDELLNNMKKNNINISIIQVFPGVEDYKIGHDEIIKLCTKEADKFYGIISINPHIPDKDFNNEVERLIESGFFRAIKLHTIGHIVNPISKAAEKVYKAAKRYNIPVMVHTGTGVPFALPSMMIPILKQYPEIDFILAHSGMAQIYAPEALFVAKVFENVYLETSWTSIDNKSWLLQELGSERIVFGSDMPINVSTELFQYKELGLSEKEMNNVLELNSRKLFKI